MTDALLILVRRFLSGGTSACEERALLRGLLAEPQLPPATTRARAEDYRPMLQRLAARLPVLELTVARLDGAGSGDGASRAAGVHASAGNGRRLEPSPPADRLGRRRRLPRANAESAQRHAAGNSVQRSRRG